MEMKTFPNKCPACGHLDLTWEEPIFRQSGEGELASFHQDGTAKRVSRWYHEKGSPTMVGHCTRCGVHPYQHDDGKAEQEGRLALHPDGNSVCGPDGDTSLWVPRDVYEDECKRTNKLRHFHDSARDMLYRDFEMHGGGRGHGVDAALLAARKYKKLREQIGMAKELLEKWVEACEVGPCDGKGRCQDFFMCEVCKEEWTDDGESEPKHTLECQIGRVRAFLDVATHGRNVSILVAETEATVADNLAHGLKFTLELLEALRYNLDSPEGAKAIVALTRYQKMGSSTGELLEAEVEGKRFRRALEHIANGGISPSIGFAQHVLDGMSVEDAHRKQVEDWNSPDDPEGDKCLGTGGAHAWQDSSKNTIVACTACGKMR